jgi:subfamily B ATP-binding cassette protein MsbA
MKLYLRLLSYLKPYCLHIIGALVCGVFFAILTGVYAWLMQPLLDDLFIKKDRFMLTILPAAIIVLSLLKGLASYGQTTLWGYIGLKIVSDIREILYRHFILLPVGAHAKNPTGRLMSYILNDVAMMQTAVSTGLKTLVAQPLTLIALAGVILYQNAKLALLAIVVVPLFIIPLAKIGMRLREYATSGQEKMGEISSHLQETLAGVRVVKAFGKEQAESDRFEKNNRAYFKEIFRAITFSEIATPLMETAGAIGVAIIIGYAGFQVIAGTMTAGKFFSFLTATMLMYGPLKVLASTNNILQQAIAGAERVFAILDEKNEVQQDTGTKEMDVAEGEIAFQNVSFAYGGVSTSALTKINFVVKAGQTIALVGHSGAGKSTLANLLPRFYEPTSGRILLDGIPINDILLASLRKQIGIVSQEVVLFNETIAWNIGYGGNGINELFASHEEIMNAAKLAYADIFIQKMQNGYQARIENGGTNLSGGERQRLAIARALLKNPPILILDEATSALDSESEFFVQKALSNLMQHRTTVVIAHRLSTVMKADCILVMEQGEIIEMGRHAELIQRNGPYKKIYLMQFEGGGGVPTPSGISGLVGPLEKE